MQSWGRLDSDQKEEDLDLTERFLGLCLPLVTVAQFGHSESNNDMEKTLEVSCSRRMDCRKMDSRKSLGKSRNLVLGRSR